VDLCTVCYNFARINTETLWDMGDIVKLIEEWEAQA
jgi:hypothetical protein